MGEFMNYPVLTLKPGRERSLKQGHPWIFSGAVHSVKGKPESGDIVIAASASGEPLALGFYNKDADIAFRMLSRDTSQPVNELFWRRRVFSAFTLRRRIIPAGTTAYRLINAEGDGMPGLVVDCYGEYLVVSISTAGIEKAWETIRDVLIRQMSPLGIYERSEGRARKTEGLADRTGLVYGDGIPDFVEITENGFHFETDIVSGQKTGFFLDQRENREQMSRIAEGLHVLNCFSYTGGFSVYCAFGGASRIVSVEASAAANEAAIRNLERNCFSSRRHPVIKEDVFSFLRQTDEIYDLIILDPPAFAKTKNEVPRAARGYKDINLQAVRRLSEGGILATFSCSNYIDDELFRKIVQGAVADAGKSARIVASLGPGGDHPINLAHPEGAYLKGLLLNIY
jgi:23S rRNA (cytosine1962-C5)-methyltransferase